MRFTQDSLESGLLKRGGSTQILAGTKPKRPRQQEPDRPTEPPTTLPEAILVEEDDGEGSPPAGIPIGSPTRGGPPAAVSSPPEDVGGPSGSEKVVEARPPGPSSPEGTVAPILPDASGGPPRPPQTFSRSAPYKSCLSETVLSLAIIPKFQATLRGLSLSESLDTMFTAALQMSNGLFVLRDDLVNAKSQNEGLSKELSETKARELMALEDLRTVREDSRAWREKAEMELQALDATLTEVRAKLLPTEEKLKETVLRLEHTENRADSAEAVARDATEKLVLAEKDMKAAEKGMREALEKAAATEKKSRERVAAVEARAQRKVAAAEARVQKAVEEYRDSPDFASEMRDGAIDAFVQGFEKCKRRLSRHFKLGNLEHFRAEDSEAEIPDTGAADTVGGPAMVVDLATGAPTIEEPASVSAAGEGHLGSQ